MSTLSRAEALGALGFEAGASPDEEAIKRAYKKAALNHHPDKHSSAGEEQRRAAEEKCKVVTEANEVLTGKMRPRPES